MLPLRLLPVFWSSSPRIHESVRFLLKILECSAILWYTRSSIVQHVLTHVYSLPYSTVFTNFARTVDLRYDSWIRAISLDRVGTPRGYLKGYIDLRCCSYFNLVRTRATKLAIVKNGRFPSIKFEALCPRSTGLRTARLWTKHLP